MPNADERADDERQDTTIHLNAAMLAAYDSGALAGLLSDYHRHELRRYLFPVLPLWIVGTLTLGRKKRAPRAERPFCGARTRKGVPCAARVVEGRARCKNHGGLSTGARTAEGRARIAESNRCRAQARAEARVRTEGKAAMNNMNGKTFLIIACLLTWLVAGPSLAQSRGPGFVDKRLGVSFTPPPGWPRDGDNALDGQIVKYSASRLDESTPPSFINVSARPAKDKMRLQDLLLIHLVIERGDPTHQIVGVAPTKVGGKDAISIATIAPSNDLRVRIRWVYVLHGGKYLCFNLSALEEDFPAKARAFEKMMSTVRWSPPKR